MLFYLVLLVADLILWHILIRALKGRNRVLRIVVLLLKTAVTALFVTLSLMIVLYRGEFAEPANAFRQIQMGAMALLLILTTGACLAVSLTGRVAGALMKREMKWPAITNIALFLLITLIVADGYFRQRLDVRIVRQDVTVRGLDQALDGLTIALISDIHISSWQGSYDRLEAVMKQVGSEKPDLVLNTGDFITYGWQEFGMSDTILRKAESLAGAFAVEGNHDGGTYYPAYDSRYGELCREMVKRSIEKSGYTLLRDSAVIISHRGVQMAVAGVVTHGHRLDMRYGDIEKVLSQLPDSLFTILLLHDPESWLLSMASGRAPQLTVAGHTHGFQAAFPMGIWSPASLFHERWKGLYELRGNYLYVTSGLGSMGMAARFFMPPEIVIITVKSGR